MTSEGVQLHIAQVAHHFININLSFLVHYHLQAPVMSFHCLREIRWQREQRVSSPYCWHQSPTSAAISCRCWTTWETILNPVDHHRPKDKVSNRNLPVFPPGTYCKGKSETITDIPTHIHGIITDRIKWHVGRSEGTRHSSVAFPSKLVQTRQPPPWFKTIPYSSH